MLTKLLMFQAKSALVVTSLVVAMTPALAASPHDAAPSPAARTSQDIESLTTVYFIIALSAMALLFVVLGFDALTGHNFVNSVSGGSGEGLSIARETVPFSLSSLGIDMDPERLLSIINSISR